MRLLRWVYPDEFERLTMTAGKTPKETVVYLRWIATFWGLLNFYRF